MKLVRPILITAGIFLLLGFVAVGLALTPSLQRWAVLRTLEKHPNLHVKVAAVSVGFSHLSLKDFTWEHRNAKVTVAQIEADYSLWAFLTDRRVEVGQLTARGVFVDASQIPGGRTEAGIAGAPAVAPGAIAKIKLPWVVVLGAVEIQGKISLAGASGRPALPGEFKLTGGQIGPGREGEFHLQAKVSNPAADAKVTSLTALGNLRMSETSQQTFDQVNLSMVIDASGPGIAAQSQLKMAAAMSHTAGRENYRLTLDTVHDRQNEPVLKLDAKLDPDGRTYAGDWTLSARSAQLESFLLGHTLPKFVAVGSGKFQFNPASRLSAMQGGVQVEASDFFVCRPELRALGTVRLKSGFSLEVTPEILRFKQLEVALAGEQPVLDLHATGPLTLNLKQRRLESAGATPEEILRLKLSGLPFAWLASFCSGAELSGGLVSGEISVVQGTGHQFTLQTNSPLAVDGVTILRAGRNILAKADVKIDAEAYLSPDKMRLNLRDVAVTTAAGDSLRASFSVTVPSGIAPAVSLEGDFTAELPALLVPLLPAGLVKTKGSVGLNWRSNQLEVLRFAAESTDAKGRLLGSVSATRAFVFDLARGRIEAVEAGEVVLANFKLGQLPLLTLPKIGENYGVSGRVGPAEATLSATQGKLTLRVLAPVSIADFSVTQLKKPLVDRLSLRLQPVVEFSDGVVTRLQSGPAALLGGADAPLAELSAELTRNATEVRTSTTFSLDLAAWSSQPLMAGRDALSAGQASGEVRTASLDGVTQVEARATINGLVANETGQRLPVANLSLRAGVDATGHISILAPILIDHAGQRSDLRFSAEGKRAAQGLTFAAKLNSDHLELPDLLMFFAAAGSPLAGEGAESASAQARALSPPAADQAPFWSGFIGQIDLDCKSVVSGHDWAMTGLTGRLDVAEQQLVLEKLNATFDEKSSFAAKGTVKFVEGLDPYQLTGDFQLTDFDTGRFLKALNPERAPMVEGIFSVSGRWEGEGLNFNDTLDRAHGTFDLTSRKGVFRGLKRSADKLSMASKAVGLVSSILGEKPAEKITGNAYQIEQLAQELGDLNYDQLTVRLVRDESLNLRLENISLLTQQIRLIGTGQLTHDIAKPVLDQTLEATLSFRALGKVEEVMGKLKALDGTRDELGYAKTKEALLLGGTLAKPDPMPFFDRLLAGKLTEALAPDI